MHPRTWRTLLKIKEASGSAKSLMQSEMGVDGAPVRTLFGVRVYLSSQVSTTETQGTATSVASSAYVFDPSQVFAVFRQDTRVEVDSSRLFNSDQSEIRAIMRADLAVANAAGVVRILGILA
jgi:HK97 family phage major capsid protein